MQEQQRPQEVDLWILRCAPTGFYYSKIIVSVPERGIPTDIRWCSAVQRTKLPYAKGWVTDANAERMSSPYVIVPSMPLDVQPRRRPDSIDTEYRRRDHSGDEKGTEVRLGGKIIFTFVSVFGCLMGSFLGIRGMRGSVDDQFEGWVGGLRPFQLRSQRTVALSLSHHVGRIICVRKLSGRVISCTVFWMDSTGEKTISPDL